MLSREILAHRPNSVRTTSHTSSVITCSTCSVIIGDKPFYEARQNSTLRNFVPPGPIITKLGMVDYLGDPYSDANFS